MKRWMLSILVFVAVGCGDRFSALSVPPPGAVAEFDAIAKKVSLSKGVAIAIECRSQYEPCKELSVAAANPDVAMVHIAKLDELSYSSRGPQQRAALVVVGGAGWVYRAERELRGRGEQAGGHCFGVMFKTATPRSPRLRPRWVSRRRSAPPGPSPAPAHPGWRPRQR